MRRAGAYVSWWCLGHYRRVVIEHLLPQLASLSGLVAITLGGSRAVGTERADSDWDLGLYYRDSFDVEQLRRLGYPGYVAGPGAWGRIMNGGAWLTVDGEPVDLLLRDLNQVERWQREAALGRFDIDNLEGHVAGVPTYLVVAEVAVGRVLFGSLPPVRYPPALRQAAPSRWRWVAAFSMFYAAKHASRDDQLATLGMISRAATQAAHARMAEQARWVLNEKGLLARAELDLHAVLDAHATPSRAVDIARDLLDIPAPADPRFPVTIG